MIYFIFLSILRNKRNIGTSSSTHSQPSSMASENPKHSYPHPAFQTSGSTKIPIYVGGRSQRSPSVEKKSRKSQDRSNVPSEQRSPEDDSSLVTISGMTSDNEYESNMSESSGDVSKPTQRHRKDGYFWVSVLVVL